MKHLEDETMVQLEPDEDVAASFAMGALHAVIVDSVGERCPDYAPGCACCRAWRAYDDLAYLFDY